MTEKEIREGLKILKIKECPTGRTMERSEDVFTAYRTFSAYEPEPTLYSNGTSLRYADITKNYLPHGCEC